ncbi:uncharacterized protein LTR77_002790 [Saxophila tyrrhenica]|uniref:Uncharacterized protein n=1 Tax=Saxophila tyrrhenica TaxID=1690608 RepID=A0AAV9PJ92_9PEZI|nr:hypothetical protein LTR77_002790 [Saxophila tyrrhenica]
MYRGQLPGFYFDEVRGKYFKIQANHVVPETTKYSRGHVAQEERISKKRKLEKEEHNKNLRQTVRRNAVLQHPVLGGIGLHREHGTTSLGPNLDASDRALVAGWRPQKVMLTDRIVSDLEGDERLCAAHYLPTTGHMMLGIREADAKRSVLRMIQWDWDYLSDESNRLPPAEGRFKAFGSVIKDVATTMQGDSPRMLVSGGDWNAGVLYMSSIGVDGADHATTAVAEVQMEGTGTAVPEFSTFHHTTGTVCNHAFRKSHLYLLTNSQAATLSRERLNIFDSALHQINTLTTSTASRRAVRESYEGGPEFGPGITFLDPNTVAFNYNGGHGEESTTHKVMLWDWRMPTGTSARFRSSKRTTGLLNPNGAQEGSQLLVSTNHDIKLFDTRMPHSYSRPDQTLMTIRHVHEGPVQNQATNGRGLLAAMDRDEEMQIYSLRTGRKIRSLEIPKALKGFKVRKLFRDVMWYDDEKAGSCLQLFGPAGVVRWSYGGPRNENAASEASAGDSEIGEGMDDQLDYESDGSSYVALPWRPQGGAVSRSEGGW